MEITELAAPGIVVAAVTIALLILRLLGKSTTAAQWEKALPFIFDAITRFVDQADRLHDQILLDYAEAAAESGDDPRLLWVIDQVELFVKNTFRVQIDLNWLIEQIELRVSERKEEVTDVVDALVDSNLDSILAHRFGKPGKPTGDISVEFDS